MTFIFVALLFGIATAVIGKMKGGSFLIWLVVGTALPGVGILAALLMRYERDEPRRACPECGAVLPITDQICRRCGEELAFPEPAGDALGAR